ncbi:MAG: anhydro-N-acetylmuramic acid kinase [Glaciecola sp.]|jgi:anhydro-N-acetylmuramic acid kinase
MLQHIERLQRIATASERLVIGLMSGTSLDGLDIALCRMSGHGRSTMLQCEKFTSVAYTKGLKNAVQQVFAKQNVSLDSLCLLNAQIGILHGNMVNQALIDWNIPNNSIDLIASHGQTIYHRPSSFHQIKNQPNSTLQLGDGDHIAALTGIITLSDFRQKHIAHGGEGAPLAMYGDYLLLSSEHEHRTLLNIGGIANITYLPSNASFDNVICSDIGPGNTIMDALARRHSDDDFDKDANIAKQGSINASLLTHLLQHPFIQLPWPKTTGPETFNLDWFLYQLEVMRLQNLTVPDQMATLNAFTAHSIANTINQLPQLSTVYVSGGGAHNPLLIDTISKLLTRPIFLTNELGVNTDAKEAILFAILANECVAGDEHAFLSDKTNQPNVSMGKLSFPS